MNNIRVVTLRLLRTYATKADAGVRRKASLLKDSETYLDEVDQEDGGVYITDFRDINKSYRDYKREQLKEKEQLRRRIVRSKVFKDTQPRFLTYVEKDHIKKLHESDPEEWTPEKLSESFPALPETVRKILKANWTPRSVEDIVKYDQRVIENWKNFKTGQLALNPALTEHLMKFKDRKITLTDRETLLEKFVPPKLEFPKPKSSFFRSIVQDSTAVKETKKSQLKLKETNAGDKNRTTRIEERSVNMSGKKIYNKYLDRERHKEREKLSFDEFLKQKINNLNEVAPEERETLMEIYKRHTSSTSLSPSTLNNDTKDVTVQRESSEVMKKNSANTNELAVKKTNTESKMLTQENATCSSLDTYVKEYVSHMETDYDYTKRIRIPKNVYKPGMTYRINDCYYDDDGEFLYRVPGLN